MNTKQDVKKAAKAVDWNPMRTLHSWGVRSSHAYAAGAIALGVSVMTSLFMSSDSRRARIGAVLAPTLFTIGLGLENEE